MIANFARVVAIDASLASTGVAVHYPDGRIVTGTIATKGKRGDTLAERSHRIGFILGQLNNYWGTADLVVIEGPAGAAPGGSTWDRAGLWWGIVNRILIHCPVAVVAPPTRAKWATGNSRSDKAAVAVAIRSGRPRSSWPTPMRPMPWRWPGWGHSGWAGDRSRTRSSKRVLT